MIQVLIDSLDNSEIVRDQIAAILALEKANQMVLASAAAKDPTLWDFDVFTERFHPWGAYVGDDGHLQKPIVNVTCTSSDISSKGSNSSGRYKTTTTYYVDCYAPGVSSSTASADEEAARNSQRIARIVRNILSASTYTYLGLEGLVWQRNITNIKSMPLEYDTNQVIPVMVTRITLDATFNEYSPQYQPGSLQYVAIEFTRASDGAIIANSDFDFNT